MFPPGRPLGLPVREKKSHQEHEHLAPLGRCGCRGGLLLAGSANPAQAGALQRIENVIDSVTCTAQTTDGGSVIAYGDAFGDRARSEAFIEGDEGVIMAGGDGQFAFADRALMSVDLVTIPGEEPAGTLTVSADVQGLGESQVETIDERLGNTWIRGTFTTEACVFGAVSMAVTGLTLDSGSMSCDGARYTFSVVSNDPAATVWSSEDFDTGICPLEGTPAGLLVLRGEVSGPYLALVLEDLEDPAKAVGALQRRGPVRAATLPLVPLSTGEELAMLDVTVELIRTGHRVARFAEGGMTRQVWATRYAADVTVTGPGVAASASCVAIAERFQVRLAPGTQDHH